MAFHTELERDRSYFATLPRRTLLDVGERAFVLIAMGCFVVRLSFGLAAHPVNALIVLSESIAVLMLVIRRPGPIAASAYTWVVAVVGTFMPLMVTAAGSAFASAETGGVIMLLGITISISAKICLNRSFGIVAANRGVKREGPYRFVRHPMYLGYGVAHVGFLLIHLSLHNLTVYAITWIAFGLRMRDEENILRQDGAYRDYSAAVRYRIIPGLI